MTDEAIVFDAPERPDRAKLDFHGERES